MPLEVACTKVYPVLRIRDLVYFFTTGSGRGKKIRIWDENPAYISDFGNNFLGKKLLNCLMRFRDPE